MAKTKYTPSPCNIQSTIQMIRATLATHRLPELHVTENGFVFTSKEFKHFMQRDGIRHVTGAPYHPATNGLVERAVHTFKVAMEKANTEIPIATRVSRFLFHYSITPQSTTQISPAKLLLGRRPDPTWTSSGQIWQSGFKPVKSIKAKHTITMCTNDSST